MTNREWLLQLAKETREHTDGHFGEEKVHGKTVWVYLGRNASHEFFAGVDSKDRLWKKATGEYIDPTWKGHGLGPFWFDRSKRCMPFEVSVRQVQDRDLGYVGHW